MDDDKRENVEDTTKYGEFVTTYFAWVPLDKQRENVEYLEKITKKEKNGVKQSKYRNREYK